jgi:hypothetical protein
MGATVAQIGARPRRKAAGSFDVLPGLPVRHH